MLHSICYRMDFLIFSYFLSVDTSDLGRLSHSVLSLKVVFVIIKMYGEALVFSYFKSMKLKSYQSKKISEHPLSLDYED